MVSPAIMEIAKTELKKSGYPLPIELIEGLIHTESRGNIGATNQKSGASGLMQVMPGTLDWYNQSHTPIPLETLRAKTKAAAAKQIQVGIWVLSRFWKSAYKYLKARLGVVPVDELAKIADLFYVAGPGAARKKLDKLDEPTLEAAEKAYPKWNALPHPKNVFAHKAETGWTEHAWDLQGVDKWLRDTPLINTVKNPVGGFLIAGLLLALANWYFGRNKK